MKRIKRLVFKIAHVVFVLVPFYYLSSCSEDSSNMDNTDCSTQVADGEIDISTLANKFYSNDVTVRITDESVIITTQDLPDHPSTYYPQNNTLYEAYDESGFIQNPGIIESQNIVLTLPRFPEQSGCINEPGLGPMGVAVNSVVFFNQQAAPGDDIFQEIQTFDQYDGHPAGSIYHYHIEPSWLSQVLGSDEFFGFLLDGFPVYGPMENGQEVTNDDLDDYHGHVSPTADFPNGIYHYHITAEYPWINGSGYYGIPGTRTQ